MKKTLVLALFLGVATQAHGYIDPGTAGAVFGGAIWPMIVGFFLVIGGFFTKFFIHPIKNGARKVWQKLRGK